jgi:hypothetical protein
MDQSPSSKGVQSESRVMVQQPIILRIHVISMPSGDYANHFRTKTQLILLANGFTFGKVFLKKLEWQLVRQPR